MNLSNQALWARFQQRYKEFPSIGLAVDLSRLNFDSGFLVSMEPRIQAAFGAMDELERGGIANPDENRMVGHYWLRNPSIAPTAEIRKEIESTVAAIKAFAAEVHSGKIRAAAGTFKNILLIGIGGSALGPEFVSRALGRPGKDPMRFYALDNTDPDGIDLVMAEIGGDLGQTLAIVISKSGGTKETRNGMLEAKAAYERAGFQFEKHAVAVTQAGSALDQVAVADGWVRRFPMWDWVGGRTSELSAVGLLPAALQGIDIDSLLNGARECDSITRTHNVNANPSAMLALGWLHAGNAKGDKDMVVIPYKDRLELLSKYLQQLIMESLGKELDLNGRTVHQGINVFGNKGSTDQHSYIQQLRDGVNNFFVTFIEVLKHRDGKSIEVEPGMTTGDFLTGFLLGTRQALFEKDRESITVTVDAVTPFSVGVLIALFERAVGLYACLVNINAYHQPGVEAGKKAATRILDLEAKVVDALQKAPGRELTVDEIASAAGSPDEVETIFKLCQHLASGSGPRIERSRTTDPFKATYKKV